MRAHLTISIYHLFFFSLCWVHRVATLDCLIEVASLPPTDLPENYKPVVQNLLPAFIQALQSMLPPSRQLDLASSFERASEQECLFISRLGLFISTFLKSYLSFFEISNGNSFTLVNGDAVQEALFYLLAISKVSNLCCLTCEIIVNGF